MLAAVYADSGISRLEGNTYYLKKMNNFILSETNEQSCILLNNFLLTQSTGIAPLKESTPKYMSALKMAQKAKKHHNLNYDL